MAAILQGPWAGLVNDEADDSSRAARLARVREQRKRAAAAGRMEVVAEHLETGLPVWTNEAATILAGHGDITGWPRPLADFTDLLEQLPADLLRRARVAGENLELDMPGAAARAADVLRQVAAIISRG